MFEAPTARHTTPNYEEGREGHRPAAIVVHTNVATYDSTVGWFALEESGVSAHYIVALQGAVGQFVDEADTARHAGRVRDPTVSFLTDDSPNLYTVGIEFEDGGNPLEVDRPDAQYDAGAELIAGIAGRWESPSTASTSSAIARSSRRRPAPETSTSTASSRARRRSDQDLLAVDLGGRHLQRCVCPVPAHPRQLVEGRRS